MYDNQVKKQCQSHQYIFRYRDVSCHRIAPRITNAWKYNHRRSQQQSHDIAIPRMRHPFHQHKSFVSVYAVSLPMQGSYSAPQMLVCAPTASASCDSPCLCARIVAFCFLSIATSADCIKFNTKLALLEYYIFFYLSTLFEKATLWFFLAANKIIPRPARSGIGVLRKRILLSSCVSPI